VPTVAFTSALHRFMPAPAMVVAGPTVGQALASVFAERPMLRGYLLDDQGALRRHVVLYVNGQAAAGLADPVGPADEIYVLQALTGG
jgi:molybdopterin converting factor small subunit